MLQRLGFLGRMISGLAVENLKVGWPFWELEVPLLLNHFGGLSGSDQGHSTVYVVLVFLEPIFYNKTA